MQYNLLTNWSRIVLLTVWTIGIPLWGYSDEKQEYTAEQQLNQIAPVVHQGTGLYLGVGVAGMLSPDTKFDAPNADPGFPASTQKKQSLGGLGDVKMGYDWSMKSIDPNWTIGVEGDLDGGAQYFSAAAISADPIVNGYTVRTGIAQGIGVVSVKTGYDLGPFRPYAGFGGGAAYLATINPKLNSADGSVTFSGSTMIAPVYRGFVGVDLFMSHDWALNMEYRYQVLSGVNFGGNIEFGDVRSHQVEMGLKYYFY